jgi:acyl-CoA synthetase (AMP-forming)/AMP-acid ligase II
MDISSPITLDALLVSRATESPAHVFLLRPEQDTADTVVQEITHGTFDAHVSRLARAWMAKQDNGELEGSPIRPRAVVGVFLPSGYTICAVLFAIIRLGAVPFCLSPRNSDEALKHLVRTGNIVTIVAATDGSLASRVKTLLRDEGDIRVPILEVSKMDLADLPSGTEFYKTSYPSLPPGFATELDIAIQQHACPTI